METLQNPADHPSRGLLGNQIKSLVIWWHAPSWLAKYEEYWPSGILTTNKSLPEESKKDPSHVVTATISVSLIDASKSRSYWKLVRTTVWFLRFLQNVRRRENSAGELTAAEIAAARMY
jgi:hypothetical protein